MILKTLGVKDSSSYGRLIDYVTRDSAALRNKDGSIFTIRHNTFGDAREVEQQFKVNESKRVNRRIDSNKLLHTIISLSERDGDKVSPEILERLSREYISRLNPDALFYGSIHMKNSPHAHLLVSGNDMLGNSTRQSKKDFEKLKQELEELQEREYPELSASVVEHGRGISKNDREWQMQHAGRVSRKEELKQILQSSFELATSRKDFFELLVDDNVKTYERNGKVTGIEDVNNFRFKTLGIELEQLDIREKRMEDLEALNENERKIEIDEVEPEEEMTVEQQRLRELDELMNNR